ncbi:hypothetical protein ABMY21_20890 [Vibrio vulnificus]|uniref:hypothetical protein n=1 Tax=Vibrio vulnificus TaxID=672 RepID=UPI00405915E0
MKALRDGDVHAVSVIPDLFNRHKDWVPPLEVGSDGKLSEPQWFLALENYLQPVLKSARELKELGAR